MENCLSCKKIMVFNSQSEFLCEECYEKIKGTDLESKLNLPEKFLRPLSIFRAIAFLIILLIQILWYFKILIFIGIKIITFLVLALPVIVNIGIFYYLIHKIQDEPKLSDVCKKKTKSEIVRNFLPDLGMILVLAIYSVFLYWVLYLVFTILGTIWDFFTGLF